MQPSERSAPSRLRVVRCQCSALPPLRNLLPPTPVRPGGSSLTHQPAKGTHFVAHFQHHHRGIAIEWCQADKRSSGRTGDQGCLWAADRGPGWSRLLGIGITVSSKRSPRPGGFTGPRSCKRDNHLRVRAPPAAAIALELSPTQAGAIEPPTVPSRRQNPVDCGPRGIAHPR